ncbi:two-component sensor histidine kinase [Arthrobacter jiangjiafuii]|uniref:histidine kinase n=1 Tax=Arthrobacter jiangjiafuii TaxID=2817475 RepID=A0A975M731_9MICC|nr:histidine kinase [Arthrobacter jiangjiafuii]MBP3044208.1 two-component sensor histidine kinase [Arthrobacter jiangjiafuii]QWC11173.1 two-component sensor histidine kinase [Arthrobacter jiangjiafuii]
MEQILKYARLWGAPVAAVVFFSLWCVGEAGRMGGSLLMWEGFWPLVLMTLAIATATWKPLVSLGFTASLLAGQLFALIPPMAPNHWAIYVGSFIALGFILWTAPRRIRFIAAGTNTAAAAVMAFLMLSWRYGDGVGWFMPATAGDRWMLQNNGWQLFALLLLIAAACSAVGLLLALYQERGSLFRAREQAQNSLKETEIDLVVEQERIRIARDLHDVLAHSLAVIAAQADGTRYLSKDQPKAILNALDTIARSARSALVDAQRVIEGVRDDGMVAPQPRLSDIPALIDGMQRGSLKIASSESGTPVELSGGQEMAVFRIVQECLTNALKHGGRGTDVRLHFDWSGPGLTLHVASTTAPAAPAGQADPADRSTPRVGRGLAGMRERAHLAGGWLTAGPDGEHFRVTAFIPFGSRDATEEPAGSAAGGTVDEAAAPAARPALATAGVSLPAAPASEASGQEADDRG